MTSPQANPLTWPAGWPRARARSDGRFATLRDGNHKKVSIEDAFDRLEREVELLRAKDVIVSSNLERNMRGIPRGDRGEPSDPGVAIYFTLKGKKTSLACDRWNRVADNIAALAAHIGALRGMDRWGVGSIEQAFTGYQALPAPEQWWQVLGLRESATIDEIKAAHRRLIAEAHPDKHGGNSGPAARINAARDEGMRARSLT